MAETQQRDEAQPQVKHADQDGARRPRSSGEKKGLAGEKRKLIIESSIKVFADKGYHDTRISDIAKHAGIAYGLVYHYFKNKEEILDTIFLERWDEFIGAVCEIAENRQPVEEKLLSIAAVVLGEHDARPEWVKVLIFEIQRTQRMLTPERVEVVGELFRVIAGILRDGQTNGELRAELDPELACYVFVGAVDIVVTSRVLELIQPDAASGVQSDEGPLWTRHAKTVVDIFMNGMSVPSGVREP